MSDLLSGLLGIFGFCLFFLGPTWALDLWGLLVYLVVSAGELVVIVLSALLPVWSPSRAGRVLLTLVALAALNFVLNLIFPFKF